MNAINERLFLLVNADQQSPPWAVQLASLAADDLVFVVPLALVALWLWSDGRQWSFRALLACLLGLGLGQLIGLAYFHPRPFMVPIGHTFAVHAADASFPSDHAILFFSTSLALLAGRQWLAGGLIAGSGVLVAWARVYLGIHFPFDMAGAVLVALLACGIVWCAWRPLGMPLLRLAEALYRTLFGVAIAWRWVRA